ncbi:large ribosomal subunit protein eL14-like [Acropora muricata]|uniref:60S ribosomal protein L14-like n=1 Tax=Acropora millepora TaxID=45264 RepID=UPI0010FCC62E|nr:60S ribosomal protein L14-like [Acropora millepora]
MVFKRFVEVGRVALINSGPDEGKLCVIVDVVDQNRALIDGPCTNVCRKALNFKYLSLTDFTVKIRPSAKSGPVREAFQKGEIQEKWEQTSWAKRLAAKKKRATLNDFDRFKLKLAKQKKNEIIREELRKLRKEANL